MHSLQWEKLMYFCGIARNKATRQSQNTVKWQKACLRHDIMPFIIDDKRRSRYLRGIKEWQVDHYELVDVVMEAQDRFEAQIERQKLYAHSRLYLPADYTED